MFIAQQVRCHRHGGIAGQRGPGAGHIAVYGNEQEIAGQRYEGPTYGQVSPPPGFAGKLVPDGQAEGHAQEKIGHEQDGNNGQALAEGFANEIADPRYVHHGAQENDHAYDHEIVHYAGIGLPGVLIGRMGEKEGLGRVAEGLNEQGHDDGYLVAGPVNAGLLQGRVFRKQVVEQYAVHGLVGHAGKARDQQGEGVRKNGLQQGRVDAETGREDGGKLQQQGDGACRQVGDEDIAYSYSRIIQAREGRAAARVVRALADPQEENVAADVHQHIDRFKEGEFFRLLLLAPFGEYDGRNGIGTQYQREPGHVLGVVGVAYQFRNGAGKGPEEGDEHHRADADAGEYGAVNLLLVI